MGPVRLIGCGAGHVCSMDTKHYRVIGARADPIVHPMNRPQSAATREEILGRTRRGRGAWEGTILLRPLNKGAPVASDAFLSALSPFHGTGKTSKSKDDSSFVVESPLRLPIELSQTFHPVLLEHVRRLSSTGPTLPPLPHELEPLSPDLQAQTQIKGVRPLSATPAIPHSRGHKVQNTGHLTKVNPRNVSPPPPT